jgi:hypothetical protein
MKQYHLVTNSVAPSQVRETEDAYIIENVPFVKPMELSGGYVPKESIEETAPLWDGAPATLQHARDSSGQPIAANRKPEIHLGIAEDPSFDGEFVRANIRITKDRLEAVDGAEAVREALENEEPIDVSSQYAARDLPAGEYDGAMHENVEEITRPDSIAILPNQRGQCSIEDGCGIDPQLVANAEVHVPMTQANGTHDGEDMDAAAASGWDATPVSPDDVDEWTDEEWDGADAVAAMPNPSEDDDAPAVLDQTHAAVPAADDDRDAKGNWKLPFRAGPDAPVNTRALVAIDAALSGARGGVEGLSDETREAISGWVTAMLQAAPEDRFGAMDEQTDNVLAAIGRRVTDALGLTAASSTDSAETMGAESPVDSANADSQSDADPADEPGGTMENRDELIDEITSNSAITAETLEDACDERVQKVHDDVVSNDSSTDNGDDAVEQIANRLDQIEDQMVTEDDLDDVVANKQTEQKEDELAREIVANSAEYDEVGDVREDYPTVAALETKRDQVTDSPGIPTAGGNFEANVGEDEPEFEVTSGRLGGDD